MGKSQKDVISDLQATVAIHRADTGEVYTGKIVCQDCGAAMLPVDGDHSADGMMDIRCIGFGCGRGTGVATLIGHVHDGEHCNKRICG